MTRQLALTAVLALLAAPALAGHANPWASEDDTILSKNHETNLAQSVGTPGEDEMRGVMEQNAHGKLDDPGRGAEQTAQHSGEKGGRQRGHN